MKSNLRNLSGLILGCCLMLGALGCSLDVSNPNSASEEQVLTTSEGIKALAVGVQQFYANTALEAYILFTGVTSRELAINTTFANLIELEAGGASLTGANGNVLAVWSRSFRVIEMAEDLIEQAPQVPLEPGTRSGIVAMGHLFKAMALGALGQAFEQAPTTVQADGRATFTTRQEVFAEAINQLDAALQTLGSTPASDEFNNTILGSGFDLTNTIHAYRARYNLLAGRYQEAINAADAVDPNATSLFSYDANNQNPIYQAVFIAEDYAPRDNFGAAVTDTNDARLDFYLVPQDVESDPNGFAIDGLAGFFTTEATPIPAYLPGEMSLIRAEAQLMLGNAGAAVEEIDAVRTKTPNQDPLGVGAALPEYEGATTNDALLEEIFRQRRAELFMSGIGWEDSRRLNRPGPSDDPFQRNRNFYPYPDQERQNNPNTPADPAN